MEAEAEREAKAVRAEQQRIEQEKIQRQNGRASAYDRIPYIDQIILDKVKREIYVYSETIVDKCPGQLSPYWEAYADYLIEYFRGEGVNANLTKTPIYNNSVVVAMSYAVEFTWLHA